MSLALWLQAGTWGLVAGSARIAAISGVAAWAGYAIFGSAPPAVVAAMGAVAAGGLLAMVAEAFDQAPEFIGLITVAGFLAAFALAKQG